MTANDDLIREARHATLALIPADHRRQAGRYLEQIEIAAARAAEDRVADLEVIVRGLLWSATPAKIAAARALLRDPEAVTE